VNSSSERPNNTSYTPSSRPLLDQDESTALQNFFENPNNLDPAFAPAQSQTYQQEAESYIGDNTSGLEWLRNMASVSAQQTKLATENRPSSQQTSGQQRQPSFSQAVPQGNMAASADDYAAAQLLLGNQEGRYNDPSQYDMSQLNGYAYPPVAAGNNASPYNFNQQNSGIYGVTQRYAEANSALNFGPNGSFRGELEETALQQLSALAEQHNAALEAGAMLKRAREGDDHDYEGDVKRQRNDGNDAEYDEDDAKGGKQSAMKPAVQIRRRSPIPSGSSKPGGARENLTEEQKRNNHIQSEQKRRNLIKNGFIELNQLVPELRTGGFSKSNSLVEAAKFVKKLQAENDELKAHVKAFDAG
jgi:hypothetical protein